MCVSAPKKRGISGLFSTVEAKISFYNGERWKYSKPVFEFKAVTRASAVYPERPELITSSALTKLEGRCGYEEFGELRKWDESWMLLKPDLKGAESEEMLRWLVGEHVPFSNSF
jgi:hypothetical protein